MPNLHPYIQFAVAGLVLGIGHAVPELWWSSFLGIAWFLYIVLRTPLTWRQVICGGILSWTIRYSCALAMYFTTYPITWLADGIGAFQIPIITFYWLTVSLFLGLAGGLTAAALVLLRRLKISRPVRYGLAGVVWLLGELVAPVLFMLCTFGAGTLLNASYTLGTTGYLLAEHETLLLAARYGGLYILTALATFLGVALLALLESRRRYAPYVAVVCIFLLIVSAGYQLPRTEPQKTGMKVALITTEFSSAFARRDTSESLRQEILGEAVAAALALKPDVIVLPEDARFLDPGMTASQALFMFEFQYGDTEVVLVDSTRTKLEDGRTVLRANVLDTTTNSLYQVDKQYLVPQGEFMPYFYSATLRLLGLNEAVASVQQKLVYAPGPLAEQAAFPEHVPSVLFCFSDVAPRGAYALSQERAVPFIAHIVSHSWFHQPTQYWHLRDAQMLRIQALWSQTPILTAGNMAPATHHSPSGAVTYPKPVATGAYYSVSLTEV